MKVLHLCVATILEASDDAVIRLSLLHSHSMAGRSSDTTSIKAHRAAVMVIDCSL
jgi:hypothetical protein